MQGRFARKFIGAAAAAAMMAASVPAQAQDSIHILTGGTPGVYYPLGVAIT